MKTLGVRLVRIDADETSDLHASTAPSIFADRHGAANAENARTTLGAGVGVLPNHTP